MDALLSVPVAYRVAALVLLLALIVGVSITPGVPRPDDNLFSWLYAGTPPLAQKVLHIILYTLLAALWMWTLSSIQSTRTRLLLSLTLTIGLGFALEWYQTRVPGRFGTLIDALLNAVGAVAGILIALAIL